MIHTSPEALQRALKETSQMPEAPVATEAHIPQA